MQCRSSFRMKPLSLSSRQNKKTAGPSKRRWPSTRLYVCVINKNAD